MPRPVVPKHIPLSEEAFQTYIINKLFPRRTYFLPAKCRSLALQILPTVTYHAWVMLHSILHDDFKVQRSENADTGTITTRMLFCRDSIFLAGLPGSENQKVWWDPTDEILVLSRGSGEDFVMYCSAPMGTKYDSAKADIFTARINQWWKDWFKLFGGNESKRAHQDTEEMVEGLMARVQKQIDIHNGNY